MFFAPQFRRPLVALAGVVLCACTRGGEQRRAAEVGSGAAVAARDDFGDSMIAARPARIVSLNPATTELIFALGAGGRLVGRTTWDASPPEALRVPDVGPGLRPSVEAVLARRPDLVILYASSDNRRAAAAFHAAGVRTLSLTTNSVTDFERSARLVGTALGDPDRAQRVVDTVLATLARVRSATSRARSRPSVFWHVWDAPLITIGRGSFFDELVEIAGGRNAYGDIESPSPQVTFEDVLRRDPDVILAGPQGAARIRSERKWSALRAVKLGKVLIVDTMLIARPSVRLGEAAMAIARLLHPELALR